MCSEVAAAATFCRHCVTEFPDQLRHSRRASAKIGMIDAFFDKFINGIHGLRLKRRPAHKQLIEQYTQHPPIHRSAVPGSIDDLGSEVVRCANKRVCESALQDLGQTHVRKLAIAP